MHKLSIKFKVLIILLILIVLMIVSMALLINHSFDKGFIKYRQDIEKKFNNNLVKSLEEFYAIKQSWDELRNNRRLWNEMVHNSTVQAGDPQALSQPPPPRHKKPSRHKKPPRHKMLPRHKLGEHNPKRAPNDQRRSLILPAALFDLQKNLIVGTRSRFDKDMKNLNINFENKPVGLLVVKSFNKISNEVDSRFAKSIKDMLVKLGLVLFLIALLVSFPIAKYFTDRIKKINKATQRVAAGDFSMRIDSRLSDPKQKDELSQLAKNFNHLAKTLESNSVSQKTMMADIAHELRTPVAVIMGEVEAIQDGVHPANEKTFNLLHSQISSLKI